MSGYAVLETHKIKVVAAVKSIRGSIPVPEDPIHYFYQMDKFAH